MIANKKIAIQGYPGAFHEIAAHCYYPAHQLEVVPADSFDDLVEMVEVGEEADGGLMAIENTIAGSLLNNYQLLNNSRLTITGEVFLRIRQNLMALPGENMTTLREVHSHPVAIEQCRQFFRQYRHIKLVASEDTALSAKRIHEQRLSGIGAIASTLAAHRYEMNMIAEGIETNKKNYTRFLVVDRNSVATLPTAINKISISFSVPHAVGSLHKVLEILASHNANMTKVQSVPLVGEAWRYIFFIDFILDNYRHITTLMEDLQSATVGLKVLGQYAEGQHFDS